MIRGAVGKEFVVKHYKGGKIVVTKYPDMSGIVASGKQRERRDLFREAVVYARWIVADEERKKAFRKTLPWKKRRYVYQAAIRLYMSMQGDKQWLRKQLAVKAVMSASAEKGMVVRSECYYMRKLKLTALLSFAILGSQAQNKNFIDQPYLEVTGSADTLVTPNEIFIRTLISEKDNKDKTSLEELEAKMFAALKSLGIDVEKNLMTNDMMSNYKSYLFKSKDIIKAKQYVLKAGDAVLLKVFDRNDSEIYLVGQRFKPKSDGEEFKQIGNPAFLGTTGNIYTDQVFDPLSDQALRVTQNNDKKPWWRIW